MKTQLLWLFHNVIAHPIYGVAHAIGFIFPIVRKYGEWVHDATVPERMRDREL